MLVCGFIFSSVPDEELFLEVGGDFSSITAVIIYGGIFSVSMVGF